MSALDRFAEWVSPSWAAKRVAARAALERNKLLEEKLRGFKATSRGRRADEWNKVGEGVATESGADLATLRVRARELRRNNPYWASARRCIVGKVVGHGIRATAQGSNVRTKKAVQAAWDAWARTKVDTTGRMDWYGVQKLVMRTVVQDGECIVRRHQTASGLRLQVLGGDFFASEKDGPTKDGGEVMGGVETDELGAPIAYHLYRRHPQSRSGKIGEVVRVPASDIAHVFEIDRPNQLRGESWVAPVFTRLVDWDDYEDADLLRHKVGACFGAVYTGIEPDDTESGDYELRDKIEPGMIEHLPNGATVSTVSPPASPGIRDAALINQRGVAAGLGITYEALSGDYERVNFSSARMGHMQMLSNVHSWQQDVMIDLLCDPVWGWFMQAYSLKPGAELDEPLSTVLNVTANWVVPSRILIDPEKETSADMKRVRSGFVPWQDVVREQGLDPDQVADAIAEDMERFDSRKIVLDIDARKVSLQGQGSINQKQEGASDGSASEKQAAA